MDVMEQTIGKQKTEGNNQSEFNRSSVVWETKLIK